MIRRFSGGLDLKQHNHKDQQARERMLVIAALRMAPGPVASTKVAIYIRHAFGEDITEESCNTNLEKMRRLGLVKVDKEEVDKFVLVTGFTHLQGEEYE